MHWNNILIEPGIRNTLSDEISASRVILLYKMFTVIIKVCKCFQKYIEMIALM